ncbi:dienelactone hydrolase family protein [Croceibacterium sp. TMG7-5b_MA50]|uniref:dienelactone hydrolase family protein n=1 Tax=Croceibacterium sp. TMG7-5b_MA50 TaxID=3121290 RepID=UPI0032218AAF
MRAGLSRRQFGAMAGFGVLAACATPEAGAAAGLTERTVTFPADGATMDAFWVHPRDGRHPAVILWPDIAGLRPVFEMMGRRLASEGYAVLVLNPYFRDRPAPQFADFAAILEAGMATVAPWRAKNDAAGVTRAARDVVAWLDTQEAVDTTRGIGNQGYCMGGPYTVWTAAAVPARLKAAASFHGGGLVTDALTSPHAVLKDTQAQYLIAIAQDDDAKAPDAKGAFRTAADAAGRPAQIEVFAGDHGWTVPDSPKYAEAEAERAWAALLALYERSL